jgi:hypothetical protein
MARLFYAYTRSADASVLTSFLSGYGVSASSATCPILGAVLYEFVCSDELFISMASKVDRVASGVLLRDTPITDIYDLTKLSDLVSDQTQPLPGMSRTFISNLNISLIDAFVFGTKSGTVYLRQYSVANASTTLNETVKWEFNAGSYSTSVGALAGDNFLGAVKMNATGSPAFTKGADITITAEVIDVSLPVLTVNEIVSVEGTPSVLLDGTTSTSVSATTRFQITKAIIGISMIAFVAHDASGRMDIYLQESSDNSTWNTIATYHADAGELDRTLVLRVATAYPAGHYFKLYAAASGGGSGSYKFYEIIATLA